MYLIDTNVISEARKGDLADAGVRAFFKDAEFRGARLYLSAITVGELRRGVERIRHRGDELQAARLETWLSQILDEFQDAILPFDGEAGQIWGRLRVPHEGSVLDKQIAAIALINDLTVVTRNVADFAGTSVQIENPFGSHLR